MSERKRHGFAAHVAAVVHDVSLSTAETIVNEIRYPKAGVPIRTANEIKESMKIKEKKNGI